MTLPARPRSSVVGDVRAGRAPRPSRARCSRRRSDAVVALAAARERRTEALGGVDGARGSPRVGAGDRRRHGLGARPRGRAGRTPRSAPCGSGGRAPRARAARSTAVTSVRVCTVIPFARCSSGERLMRRSASSNAPDAIGDAACGVRRVRAPLERDHLESHRAPVRAGRAHPASSPPTIASRRAIVARTIPAQADSSSRPLRYAG